VLGYRIAMLISGALALILADHYGWHATYWAMACLMLACVVATATAPEPALEVPPPRTLGEAVLQPFGEYFRRNQAVALLLLVVLYKLGDAFAVSLSTTFLLRGVGLTLSEIGVINKGLALAATIIGALFGGALMGRLGLFRSLLLFGVLQAVSNLTYAWLALSGKSYALVIAAVGLDNLAGGMGTTAFVALLMSLCDKRYTATQFALLSAAGSVARVFVGPPSGMIVAAIGWAPFFFVTFLIALPGLMLLWALRGALPGEQTPRVQRAT
jgi:PAT family beta-lactamase induction signal transducer AmpG